MEIDRSSELTEVIITTDPSDWRYIAEGSANLTIAYSPPPSRPSRPQLKNKCLRLRKRPISSAPEDPYPHRSGSPDQQACPSCPRERRIDSSASSISTGTKIEGIDFHRRIIGSLMGPHLLLNFEPVKLESAWLSNLVTVIEPTRPNSKRVQESIDAQMQIALMMDNLTSNPAEELAREMISVEIKPKWSFLPQAPNLLDSSTAGVKTEFCRTCVFRAVRSIAPEKLGTAADRGTHPTHPLTHSDSQRVNHYYVSSDRFCALQLFNVDSIVSLRDALDRLHFEWRHQHDVCSWSTPACASSPLKPSQKHNNFKVFRDGSILDPSAARIDQQIIDLLAQALERSGVLRRLDHLQKRLDPLDIEGIFDILKNELGNDQLHDFLQVPIALNELDEILPLMSDEIEWKRFKESFDRLTGRTKLIMYMLSMTFKDCSIFVRLPAHEILQDHAPSIIKPIDGLTEEQILELVDIRLIDLDLKPLLRLSTYFESDRKMYHRFKTCYLSSRQNDRQNPPVTCRELCGKSSRDG